jgi:hypothetical protein
VAIPAGARPVEATGVPPVAADDHHLTTEAGSAATASSSACRLVPLPDEDRQPDRIARCARRTGSRVDGSPGDGGAGRFTDGERA